MKSILANSEHSSINSLGEVHNLEMYRREELTVSAFDVQLISPLYSIPFLIPLGVLYYMIWGEKLILTYFMDAVLNWGHWLAVFLFGIILFGIVLHELIHGVVWAKFVKNGLNSIEFGVKETPYCHCKEPLSVKHYIIGAFMPGLVLGIIPSFFAVATGSLFLILFGLFFTLAACGDFMMISILIKQPMDSLVQDHPKKMGCYIFRPKF